METNLSTKLKTLTGPIFVLVVFFAAIWLLHRELSQYHFSDFMQALESIPTVYVVAAIGLTFLNYVILVGYDWLGVRYVGHPMSFKRIALTSFLGNAVGNNFGSLLGGSTVRYRLYSNWGMSGPEIVRLVLLLSITFWIGLIGIAGLVMVMDPAPIPDRLHLPFANSLPLGVLFCLLTIGYLIVCASQETIRIRSRKFSPPPLKLAGLQYLVSSLDFVIAAAVLYVLLPSTMAVGFWHFLAIFLLAIVLAVLSTVPGGLGVFELTIIVLLDGTSSHELVGSLLAFRLIYYLIPLLAGLVLLGINEYVTHRESVKESLALSRKWSRVVAPRVLTFTVFLSGVILLISGATPAEVGRMGWLRDTLPLPAIEVSHFLGSIFGVLLLVLARGLQRRIETAWYLTIVLLAGGIITSLLKGFDWEEAVLLSLMLFAILPAKSCFFRKGSLFSTRFSLRWIVAVVMVVGLTAWLLFFAYRHLDYQGDLWWQFAFNGNAPRSMRAMVGVCVVALMVVISRLTSSRGKLPGLPSEQDIHDANEIVKRTPTTTANLARLGDKRFLFDDSRTAFIMYGEAGSSLIAMGDPVGAESHFRDLIWEFRDLCEVNGRVPVFYQVDEERAAAYVETGLTLLKIGEEARVSISDFSLEGSSRKDFRRADRKLTEAGCTFEVVGVPDVLALMPRLKEISDAWMGHKNAGEKGFSLGFFKPDYVMTCPIAVVRQNGEVVAFANVWEGAEKEELSIDLMRYMPETPNGLMEFLFLKLMLWGREQGYRWFSLGMAPLAGIEGKSGSPIWNRVAELAFRHGEHFYNFQGLRTYKDKFAPEWKSKYIACPGGLRLPIILANLTTLISGGVTKLLRR